MMPPKATRMAHAMSNAQNAHPATTVVVSAANAATAKAVANVVSAPTVQNVHPAMKSNAAMCATKHALKHVLKATPKAATSPVVKAVAATAVDAVATVMIAAHARTTAAKTRPLKASSKPSSVLPKVNKQPKVRMASRLPQNAPKTAKAVKSAPVTVMDANAAPAVIAPNAATAMSVPMHPLPQTQHKSQLHR